MSLMKRLLILTVLLVLSLGCTATDDTSTPEATPAETVTPTPTPGESLAEVPLYYESRAGRLEGCEDCHPSVSFVNPVSRGACEECHGHQYEGANVSTPYGYYRTRESITAGPEEVHQVHSGDNRWSDHGNCSTCHRALDCGRCHERVEHATHGSGNCTACHGMISAIERPDCEECHGEIHPGQEEAHVMRGECEECHSPDLNVDHESCNLCHKEGGIPDVQACTGCHPEGHGDLAMKHESSSNCTACHDVVLTRSHNVSCQACHDRQVNSTMCTECHERHEDGHPMSGVNDTCEQCHPDGHPLTLSGCEDCHPDGHPTTGDIACSECHDLNTAHQAPSSRCTTCHGGNVMSIHRNKCEECHGAVSLTSTKCTACHDEVCPNQASQE